ncbi:MAG: CapA family protein [Lachnospiraceae bacterium]|nr:CapA family protein [Lachnospiraceae bacterium]
MLYNDYNERAERIIWGMKKGRKTKRKLNHRAYLFAGVAVGLIVLGVLTFQLLQGGSGERKTGTILPRTDVVYAKEPTTISGTPQEWKALEEALVAETPQQISLVMVGDMLMHLKVTQSGLMEDGTYNYDHIFEHVKDDISRADIALINQEVILGGKDLGYSGYPMFNTAFELGDAIADAGFDVVLHATNHTMDKGRTGLLNCLNYWEEKHPDMAILGANKTQEEQDEIYVYEQNGIKVAILNFTYGLNGLPMPSDMPFAVDMMTEAFMAEQLDKANEVADFVVVCPHWGIEYQTTESANQHMWCDFFLEHGVDLVIGTHPHVIQPIEWIENEQGDRMLVYFSLGNFINSTADTGVGIGKRILGGMAKVTISKNKEGEVYISDYGVEPLITQIMRGAGNMTTYKLCDYTEELAATNQMTGRDPQFSIASTKQVCREVFGELYQEE